MKWMRHRSLIILIFAWKACSINKPPPPSSWVLNQQIVIYYIDPFFLSVRLGHPPPPPLVTQRDKRNIKQQTRRINSDSLAKFNKHNVVPREITCTLRCIVAVSQSVSRYKDASFFCADCYFSLSSTTHIAMQSPIYQSYNRNTDSQLNELLKFIHTLTMQKLEFAPLVV